MIPVLLIINFLWMLLIPVLLGDFLNRRMRANWGLFGIGAATFVLSQVGHLPFNWLILQRWQLLPTTFGSWGNLLILALFLGLSAGIFEETARFITYRFWARQARSWRDGLMVGAGHGGIEAMLLGLVGLVNLALLSRMREGALTSLVTPEQWPIVQTQIEAMFTMPWYLTWAGALERLFAIAFHLAASCLVLLSVVRGQKQWLLAAVGWHTLLNAAAVVGSQRWGIIVTEAILGGFGLVSLLRIFWTQRQLTAAAPPIPEAPSFPSEPEPPPLKPRPLDKDSLDRSRYS